MRFRLRAPLAGLALLAAVLSSCTTQAPTGPDESIGLAAAPGGQGQAPGRYIVLLSEPVRQIPEAASDMARAHGLTVEHVYRTALRGFSAVIPEARLQRLRQDPRVDRIVPDRLFVLGKPPWAGGGGDDPPAGQEVPWGITRVGGPVDASGLSAVAWIIDTGVDLDNPDLNVDVSRSANFVTKGKSSSDDGHGHGTHVAGTIAAIDNEIDVVGVAAGATVVGVRVLDNRGSGYYSWIIAGVDYVATNGQAGDVANMSLGGPAYDLLDQAVANAASLGIRFALAAGNESDHAGNHSPARANGTNIYTVSAIDSDDRFASFSNYGNPPIDYAAPGVQVLSLKRRGGTTTKNGTSMAAPHLAGILLLGSPASDGSAIGDPDGNADPIAHH
jgi:hypothetical protein